MVISTYLCEYQYYDRSFVSNEINDENNPVDFSMNFPHNSSSPYNHPISENEVIQTIIALFSKQSAPGIDQITSTMLQHLHSSAISYFTILLNRILVSVSLPYITNGLKTKRAKGTANLPREFPEEGEPNPLLTTFASRAPRN